ncbi:MAG: preprotein translocase subunit SecE [Thermoleophilia bacterium]|nr:preprotein translocase subunit SecE [Thermoleophilia bacterium]
MARSRTRRSKDFQAPAVASAAERSRARRQQVRPVGEVKAQTGQKRERRGGIKAFAGESAAELKKVEWPGQRQLVSATVVVLIAIAVVGLFLWAADEALSRFVRDVLLR